MNNNDSEILETLERLGAQFPWDAVAIWVQREPGGQIKFTAYIPSDFKRHTNSAFGHADTLGEACANLIKDAGVRDPVVAREAKIAELKEQIQKLQALDLSLPPYRPGTRLAAGALNRTIEVETAA